MAHFVVDVCAGLDRIGDEFADGIAVASAETVDGDLELVFADLELGGGGGAWGFGSGEAGFKQCEEVGFVFLGVFGCEGLEALLDESEGPFAIEAGIWVSGGMGFEGVAGFGFEGIPFDDGGLAAAFEGFGAVPGISDEVFEATEEVGAEAAAVGVGGGEAAGFDE